MFGVLNLPWTFFNFGQADRFFFESNRDLFWVEGFFSLRRKLEKQERGLPIINEQSTYFYFFLGGGLGDDLWFISWSVKKDVAFHVVFRMSVVLKKMHHTERQDCQNPLISVFGHLWSVSCTHGTIYCTVLLCTHCPIKSNHLHYVPRAALDHCTLTQAEEFA